jgi:hypothetical protein
MRFFAVGQESREADFIRCLNETLDYTDLVTAIMVEMEPETPQAELDSLLSQAKSITKDELVRLNRLSLEALYEEACPSTDPGQYHRFAGWRARHLQVNLGKHTGWRCSCSLYERRNRNRGVQINS